MTGLTSDVSSWSRWPSQRAPSTFAFERLPSQQAEPDRQKAIEDAARPAIEGAGFVATADPIRAAFTVELGVRVEATAPPPFGDPYWATSGWRWHFGYGPGRAFWRPGWPYGWGAGFDDVVYRSEVSVLIRDHGDGKPLFESHAVSEGYAPPNPTTLPAMFDAAMKDFPLGAAQPHRVTVPLGS